MTELKPGWKRVKFGEVVRLNNDTCKDPMAAGIERVIGLEHLEPGDLRVRSWADVADGTTFTNRVRSGQVLFGKRRAYQRKVAVAEFDAVCSGDIYVLESADKKRLIPELLPFLCQSDSFFEHAVGTSAGSLSPRTNWKSLAAYDFALPPIDEQRAIAKAFTTSQLLSNSLLSALEQLDQIVSATAIELIARPIGLGPHDFDIRNATISPGWSIETAESMLKNKILLALQDGNHGAQYPKAEELGDEGYPYISASDISLDGLIDLGATRRIKPDRAQGLRIPPAKSGDVILSHNATVGRVSRLPHWDEPIVASTSTTYYRCNEEKLDSEYLRWFLESQIFQFQLQSVMRQSTRNQVPITMQRRLLFAWPPIDVQRKLASIRIDLRSARKQLQARRDRALAMPRFL